MVGLSPIPKARTIKGIQAIGEIGRKSPISGSNAFANLGKSPNISPTKTATNEPTRSPMTYLMSESVTPRSSLPLFASSKNALITSFTLGTKSPLKACQISKARAKTRI